MALNPLPTPLIFLPPPHFFESGWSVAVFRRWRRLARIMLSLAPLAPPFPRVERRRLQKVEEARAAAEAEGDGVDPEMAALMGFGGFKGK